jgi:hypothetical protein
MSGRLRYRRLAEMYTRLYTYIYVHIRHTYIPEKSRDLAMSFGNISVSAQRMKTLQEQGLAPTQCQNVSAWSSLSKHRTFDLSRTRFIAVQPQGQLTNRRHPAVSTHPALAITKSIAVDTTEAQSR